MMGKLLNLKILPQPTETTCGPTCLHAIYAYFGDRVSLGRIIKEIPHLKDGGTLAVMLGTHALRRGYTAKIHTYNLHIFDPTWFLHPGIDLRKYLAAQRKVKRNKKLRMATDAYIEFLELGGEIVFEDLTPQLLKSYLQKNQPILTGLSATYLYRSAREIGETNEYNSVEGEPSGHFVILSGYERKMKNLMVADPFHLNPFAGSNYYWVDVQRVISSILLGIVTYDANLLIIEPGPERANAPESKMKHLIILDNPNEWKISVPGVEVYSARDYLTREEFRKRRNVKVYNLCKSYRYQTLGYYVSLLAAARGHKPIPSVLTIQDLKSPPIIRSISEDLDELVQSSLEGLKSNDFTLSIYFGQNLAKRYDRLSSHLFKLFQSPFLRAHFQFGEKWELQSIKAISALEVPENHYPYVEGFARTFFKGRRGVSRKEVVYNYDLAILVNDEEELPPSDKKALQRFVKAANESGLSAEFICREDYGRLAEFDALFIRETTSVNHHTYRFARKAKAEGLVVIDDPDSILKCTNKIYLAELLEAHKIRTPKTIIAHRDNVAEVQQKIGFPCILKQPDSAFSIGVKKASNLDQLVEHLENFWIKSDLVIAQEFLPTEFDWRIGVIDKTPFYACKYFMAQNHWQIIKQQEGSAKHVDGRVTTISFEEVPENVINVALKACNLIGDGLYGVDIKESGGKCYVIEINDNPNIDYGYEDAILKMDLYTTIMDVFRDRIEKKKQRAAT